MPIATAYIRLRRAFGWPDLLILAAVSGVIYGLVGLAGEWGGSLRPAVQIDLSPWALPRYTLLSLSRGIAAYGISFLFTLVYGYAAASSRGAEKILLPLLDILQSIPVLGFMPGLVLASAALFPHSNVGLEIAAIIMIFTGQAWNMTFSFYRSLRTIPPELREAASMVGFTRWQRLRRLELPYASIGLIWNSMMSMAGGWFFLMVNEAFVLGDHDFRLPGIGSYMSVAIMEGNVPAMVYAIIAMTLMIVAVDQIIWRPATVWAQKFKVEETGSDDVPRSFVLELLRKSRLLPILRSAAKKTLRPGVAPGTQGQQPPAHAAAVAASDSPWKRWRTRAAILLKVLVTALVAIGLWRFVGLLASLPAGDWALMFRALGFTATRVLAAVALGTLIMVPLGVVIGSNVRLARLLQPAVQIAASFPAPMVFPAALLLLTMAGVSIQAGAVVLMMLGTQWYILFNVIAGVATLPGELREATTVFRLPRWDVWKTFILPGIFPSLVTGWVTAAGGAWNASIVAEYVHYGHTILVATGLGSTITLATDRANYPALAAGVFLMSGTVVLINRFFWRRLYQIAERR
jgi:NitT/TauT family transport system permease protein